MTRLARRAVTVAALLAVALHAMGAAALAAEKPKIVGAHLGLGDGYKLGCWAPLRVEVEGGDTPLAVTVLAITPDNDGVGVATSAPGGRPLSTEPGRVSEERLYVRIGQQNAPVEVRIYADGREVDRHLFPVNGGDPAKLASGEELPLPQAATDRLIVQAGADVGVTPPEYELQASQTTTAVTLIDDAADLPRDAIGYDGVNQLVLVAGSRAGGAQGSWLGALTPSDDRVRALVEWVKSGGRIVVSCGAGAPALLAPGGPLAEFSPGDFVGPSSIAVATAIERFTDAPDAESIDLRGGALNVASFENARGQVLAFAGRSVDETPLIFRTPLGFGEVTFVAFDLDAPLIVGWKGRPPLLRRLLGIAGDAASTQPTYNQGWYNGQDLVNVLLARLDNLFTGVRTAPFLAIVGLVALYLLLIGPGDYFFVKKVLGRVEATWVTFPLLVALTSAAAYYGAYWLKGDRLRVNYLEIIDVDTTSGQSRGLLVTHLFSPRAERYDLSLAPKTLAGEPLTPTSLATAWLGKPGHGLGGMQTYRGNDQTGVRPNYQIDATPLVTGVERHANLVGLPVQVWSTKSLVASYGGPIDRAVDSRLAPNRDGLIEGNLTNDTGVELSNCRLLYGSWAWKLGELVDGETVTVDPSISPLKITTLLGKVESLSNPYANQNRWKTIPAIGDALSAGAMVTANGEPASRYLTDRDLTHHLAAGRALLLATLDDGPRSELVRPDCPLVSDEENAKEPSRRSWVFARFILPVSDE
ncbi:hypothetical protein Pla108_36590 [Botrimarina colliarenosi]|uniref:Uncharacterized protein n=1 Tax=Botrimarina colliarenosi TaxID=2528001 RepID=A0A5C6A6A6_9BACT|nr:hypothetical protein [Botrimarina colliarenosi]TWT94808.1 hypothetical protein Pla108_36590 [Botrimarina colliarenosi]